ncbi:single-stranded DNA-binding protein [Streptomyces sp. NPDC058773]|uniref:single-stranded DNA-binding protein n=1 Tax=Streptomyces sp. NPDC058773 TaxID=3346632 RepID=UPI00369680E3
MVTLVGNAATAVEHRQTAAGVTVARFRLAATPRRWDKSLERWTDGETSFYTVRSWRGLADNVAASVAVGEPLIVQGRLRLREGEQPPEKGGQRWFSAEVDAVAIGHDLTRGTAAFRRVLRSVPRTGMSGMGAAADGVPAPAQQSPPVPGSSAAPEPSEGQGPFSVPVPSPASQCASGPEPSPAMCHSQVTEFSPAPHSPTAPYPPSSPPSQPQPPPRPAPPAQQDLWEGPFPDAAPRATVGARTATNPTTNTATNPTASRAGTAPKAADSPKATNSRKAANSPKAPKAQSPFRARVTPSGRAVPGAEGASRPQSAAGPQPIS